MRGTIEMINKNKEETFKRKYQMKNEFLMTLRYFFETHANPLPYCSVNSDDIEADVKPKRAYISFGDFDNKETITYVYAYHFENIVAKGYPLETVIKTLKDHGILVSNEEAEQFTGALEDCLLKDQKVYAIRQDVLDDRIHASVATDDEAIKKTMLLMMLLKRRLENALSWMNGLSPHQLKEKNVIGKMLFVLSESHSMAGGLDHLFLEATALMDMLKDSEIGRKFWGTGRNQ